MKTGNPLPQIFTFSSAYFLVDGLYVEVSNEIDTARINDRLYGVLQEEIYDSVQTPILFRHSVSGRHFEVDPSSEVPIGTVEVPTWLSDGGPIGSGESTLLIAKPLHAKRLNEIIGVEG